MFCSAHALSFALVLHGISPSSPGYEAHHYIPMVTTKPEINRFAGQCFSEEAECGMVATAVDQTLYILGIPYAAACLSQPAKQ